MPDSDSVAGSTQRNSLAAPAPPPTIPDHELLRRIGQGSYGEVWLARNVMGTYRAAKIVYRSKFDSERPYHREFEGLQKFEPVSRTHESQVDILQVGRNDAGGYFYHVMELADDERTGQQIDPDHYHPKTLRSELRSRGCLPSQECVRIGLALTTALAHLHKHGLIHRDVKPSNIIFVNGLPKLADIGLVTSMDATCSFVGTIGYLPPQGPGTPQADLYSLGKVLYEASTGKDRLEFPELPTDLESLNEEKGIIELNAVLVKACKLEARERYQSADEMHEDLLLLLAGRSVRRTHAMERRLKIMTRVGVGMAAIIVLGAAPYYWAIKEARRAIKGEQAAIREATRSQQVSIFLQSLLRSVDPSVARGRDTSLLRRILEQASARTGEELQGQPDVQAQLYLTIGVTYWRLGALTNAEALMRKAVDLRRSAPGDQDPALASALANLGAILFDASDPRGAEAVERQAVAIQRHLTGNDRTNLATTLNNLGLVLQSQGKLADAEDAEQEALAIRKQVLGQNSLVVAATGNNLAMLQFQCGDLAGAETNFGAALALARKLLPEEDPFIATLENNEAEIMKDRGELEEAKTLHRKILDARKRLYPEGHPDVAYTLNQLAAVLAAQGELDEAEVRLGEARAMENKLHLEKHANVADSLATLALVQEKKGDLPAAESYYKQALAIRREVSGDDSLDAAESYRTLALIKCVRGDDEGAAKELRRVLAIGRKIEGDGHVSLVGTLRQLAWVLSGYDDPGAAQSTAEAMAIASKAGVYGLCALTESLYELVDLLAAQARFAEAELLMQEIDDTLNKPACSLALRRRGTGQLAHFYEAWARAQPDDSISAKAIDWRSRLDHLKEMQARSN